MRLFGLFDLRWKTSQVLQTGAVPADLKAENLAAPTKPATVKKALANSELTDPHDPWIGEVVQIAHGIEGVAEDVAAAPYFTDASTLTPTLGSPPTVIIGPGELAMAHQTDEYCLVSRIERAAEIYSQLIRKWCRT